jgi:nicotinate-nucleotide adenylyltransferase
MRIGIFGGSFDPIHLGHLWVAEAALETCQLAEIRWLPAATSPLKPDGTVASDEDRLQMVHLAVSGCAGHVVDDREIRRGDVSYTVDTAAEISGEFPAAEIVMVIGSDSLASLPQWHQPARLLELVIPAVVQRGGNPPIDFSVLQGIVPPDRIELFRSHVIQMPQIELSSSELRQRVAAGKSIRFRVPRAVEALIAARSLYRPGASEAPS